jgi:NADPH:quinone reductase-like Zn-dependent oxidoreductase
MKVARARGGAGVAAITIHDEPMPTPGPGEALVRLHAATLNFRDHLFADGILKGMTQEPDYVPLSCGAGEVVSLGDGVTRVKAGDRVTPIFNLDWINGPQTTYRMLGGPVDGVGRQYAVFPAEGLALIPDRMGDLEAATLTCAGLTAWSALTQYARIQPGQWVLTHGTGGVSLAALQFAKGFGAKVAITSSSDAKLERAKVLGADLTVNHRETPDWAAAIRKQLGEAPIANVVDTVGATQYDDNASLLAEGGQLSAIGMLGSEFSWTRQDPGVNLCPVAVGNRDQHEAMTAFIAQHGIRPVVDVVYDLDRIQDAFHHLTSGKFFGKVGVNLL